MRIAGKSTDKQWEKLRRRLKSKPSPRLWKWAFRRFYRVRIETRYLQPIALINSCGKELGEGFSIVALFCSLVEFLESCEKGDNFHFIGKTNEKLSPHEYDERQGSRYFKSFLKTRKPFDTLFPSALIDSFYQDVRCGLLHEARTKGGWIILAEPSGGELISTKGNQIVLFRNELIRALESYFTDYQERLLTVPNTQEAFLRKFDHLCKP